jgi:hypothetical protein
MQDTEGDTTMPEETTPDTGGTTMPEEETPATEGDASTEGAA